MSTKPTLESWSGEAYQDELNLYLGVLKQSWQLWQTNATGNDYYQVLSELADQLESGVAGGGLVLIRKPNVEIFEWQSALGGDRVPLIEIWYLPVMGSSEFSLDNGTERQSVWVSSQGLEALISLGLGDTSASLCSLVLQLLSYVDDLDDKKVSQ